MSIEALNWARKTHCGDAMAKSLLRAIGDYADEAGLGWPSLGRLADDCDMSVDSVRRRLKVLEEIGVIATRRAWMDEHGRRNHDGRGRETSRDIQCLLQVKRRRPDPEDEGGADAAPDAASQSCADDTAGAGGGVAIGYPSQQPPMGSYQQGAGSQSATPGVALQPPLEPPLNPHLKDSPPFPPPGARESAAQGKGEDQEPEHFGPAWAGWPGHETMRRDLALREFRQLAPDRQLLARAAVPLFVEAWRKARRSVAPPHFHLWLRRAGFEEFPHAKLAPPAPEPVWIAEGSEEARAHAFVLRLAGLGAPVKIQRGQGADQERGYPRKAAIGADMRAMLAFEGDDRAGWLTLPKGSAGFAAWQKRFEDWCGRALATERRWLEEERPEHRLSAVHPDFRLRDFEDVIRVPCPWPPKRDGTLYGADHHDPPAGDGDDDAADL